MTATTAILLPLLLLLYVELAASQSARLVDGQTNREGRVEILYQGVWGTICSDGWTDNDATVICRMIGFTGIGRGIQSSSGFYPPGPNTEPVWFRVVQCTGTETVLTDCPYQLNSGRCQHSQDAGAICLGDLLTTTTTIAPAPSTTTLPPRICNNPSTTIRLMTASGAVGYADGRVQVLYNNSWRAICNDQWGSQDAQVVCSMLCFNPANARAILVTAAYGNATEGYWLTGVQCTGTERDIANCTRSAWGAPTPCDVTQAASVSCLPDTLTTPPVPTPAIDCSNNQITAQFSRTADPLLLSPYLSVYGPGGLPLNCSYSLGQNTTYAYISIPFIGSCNTNRTLNTTHVTYSNVVIYNVPPASPVITRTNVYYVPVSCSLPREVDPANVFNPQTRTAPPSSGSGQFSVAINFYTDNRFQSVLQSGSAPVPVALGDWMYVAVQLIASDPTLKLILDQCYVSPSQNPTVTPQYFLIGNRCAVEQTVTVYPLNNTMIGFRFQSFKFLPNVTFTYMYLHCRTYTCSVSETTGNCNPSCVDPTATVNTFTQNGRRRRAVSNIIGGVEYDVITGPFWIVLTNDNGLSSISAVSSSMAPINRNMQPSGGFQSSTATSWIRHNFMMMALLATSSWLLSSLLQTVVDNAL